MFFYEIPDGKIKNCPPNQENYRKFRLFTEEVNQLPRESDFYDGIFIWRDENAKTTEVYVDGQKLMSKGDSIGSIIIDGQEFFPGAGGSVDLTGIVAGKGSVDGKQDKLTAGNGITLQGNTISATGLHEGDVIATQQDLEAGLNGKQDKFFDNLDPDGSIYVDGDGNLKINPDAGYQVSYRQGPGIAIETDSIGEGTQRIWVRHDSTISITEDGKLHADGIEIDAAEPLVYDQDTDTIGLLYDEETLHITPEGNLAVNEDQGLIYKTRGYTQESVAFPLKTTPFKQDDPTIGGTVSLVYNNAHFTTGQDEQGGQQGYHSGLNLKIYEKAQAPIYFDTFRDGLTLKYDEDQMELDYSGALKLKDSYMEFKDDSLSLAGTGNLVGGGYNSIVTGKDNTVGASTSIVGGESNVLNSSSESSLVAGKDNVVNSSFNMVTGVSNSCNSIASIMGGQYNKVYGQNGMVTGTYNSVKAKNYIVGGDRNKIENSDGDTSIASDCVLVQGSQNTVKGPTRNIAVIGEENTVGASVDCSVLIGKGLTCQASNQLVVGMYNSPVSPAYAFVVGGGTSSGQTTNVFMLDWSGNIHMKKGAQITYDL